MSQHKLLAGVLTVIVLLAGFMVMDTIFSKKYFISSTKVSDKKITMNTPAGWKQFTSPIVSFSYPSDFQVGTKELNRGNVVTVEGAKGKVAIFSLQDYKNDRPVWVFPDFSENARQYLPLDPEEELTVGDASTGLGVWLFYKKGDVKAKEMLQQIYKSIVTN